MSHFTVLVLTNGPSVDTGETVAKLLAPFNEQDEAYCTESHQEECDCAYQKDPNPSCGECGGTGKYEYKTNPNAQWDWFAIGGRWSGKLLADATKDPSWGSCPDCPASQQDLPQGGNVMRVGDLFDADDKFLSSAHAVLTPDGDWGEKGSMGWWGIVTDEKDDWADTLEAVVRKHRECTATLVDCHI